MQVGHISPIMTAPVVVPVPDAGGAKVPGNGGIVPPWLQNPITIQPWPLPGGNDASDAAQWSNN